MYTRLLVTMQVQIQDSNLFIRIEFQAPWWRGHVHHAPMLTSHNKQYIKLKLNGTRGIWYTLNCKKKSHFTWNRAIAPLIAER